MTENQNPFMELSAQINSLKQQISMLPDSVIELAQKTNAPAELKLYSREQTAEIFDVSLVTLTSWVNTGQIKAQKIGKRVYFFEKDIIDALKPIIPLSNCC